MALKKTIRILMSIALVLLCIALGGKLAGITGMLLTVPCVLMLRAVCRNFTAQPAPVPSNNRTNY